VANLLILCEMFKYANAKSTANSGRNRHIFSDVVKYEDLMVEVIRIRTCRCL